MIPEENVENTAAAAAAAMRSFVRSAQPPVTKNHQLAILYSPSYPLRYLPSNKLLLYCCDDGDWWWKSIYYFPYYFYYFYYF